MPWPKVVKTGGDRFILTSGFTINIKGSKKRWKTALYLTILLTVFAKLIKKSLLA
jgi:hypothetical protein